jgi:hypothetical protein
VPDSAPLESGESETDGDGIRKTYVVVITPNVAERSG